MKISINGDVASIKLKPLRDAYGEFRSLNGDRLDRIKNRYNDFLSSDYVYKPNKLEVGRIFLRLLTPSGGLLLSEVIAATESGIETIHMNEKESSWFTDAVNAKSLTEGLKHDLQLLESIFIGDAD